MLLSIGQNWFKTLNFEQVSFKHLGKAKNTKWNVNAIDF